MHFVVFERNTEKTFLLETLSTFYTKETYDYSRKLDYVAENNGGTRQNYDILWTDDNRVYTHDFTIKNGVIVFGEQKNKFSLGEYKQTKVQHLSTQCEQSIEEGFISTNGHFYRTNRDDQTNFMGEKEYLNDHPEIEEVVWKTEDEGYLPHAREEWIKVFHEGIQHKKQQLYKYDKLRALVNAATTQEEVDAINW